MSARLIRSLHNVTPDLQNGVITIGNFDGVHLGHQKLIADIREKAAAQGLPVVVITFEPHPFEFFAGKGLTIPRLTRLREKFCALAKVGVENVVIMPFNQRLASQSPQQFVLDVVNALKPQHIIIGDDFRFGYQREGDIHLLTSLGKQHGFTVEALKTVTLEGERVSSTRIRKAIAAGQLDLAARLLNHPYTLMGRISAGDQRGRQWGFPTANIFLHRRLTPVRGVYTVYMHGIDDHPLPGVANIGTRPSVDGTKSLLEVHLLDFDQNIYGRYVAIEFCQKLRDEQRYTNLDLLKEQIATDVVNAKAYFHSTQPDNR